MANGSYFIKVQINTFVPNYYQIGEYVTSVRYAAFASSICNQRIDIYWNDTYEKLLFYTEFSLPLNKIDLKNMIPRRFDEIISIEKQLKRRKKLKYLLH